MGWLFSQGQTRAQLIDRLTKPWTYQEKGVTSTCLAHTARGNVLWTVWEQAHADGSKQRFIGCDLMKPQAGYGWGFKDMEESSGPYYYTCPLSYLDMVPEVTNQEWRDKVRKYHERTGRKLTVGDRVALIGSTVEWVRITELKPLLGIGNDGRVYRISRRFLGDVIEKA